MRHLRVWVRNVTIVALSGGCGELDAPNTPDAATEQLDSGELNSGDLDGGQRNSGEVTIDASSGAESATGTGDANVSTSTDPGASVTDIGDAFVPSSADASIDSSSSAEPESSSNDTLTSSDGTSSGDGGLSGDGTTTSSGEGSSSASLDAGCDGGECDASSSSLTCVALDDVLPAYLSTLGDGQAAVPDAGDAGPTPICGFPPCIAALLHACEASGNCVFNNSLAGWDNGTYIELSFSPVTESVFRSGGTACLHTTETVENSVTTYTWEDGCGSDVATGVLLGSNSVAVTCLHDASEWVFDRGDGSCPSTAPQLSFTSYDYFSCEYGDFQP